jgi:hypothetical protein
LANETLLRAAITKHRHQNGRSYEFLTRMLECAYFTLFDDPNGYDIKPQNLMPERSRNRTVLVGDEQLTRIRLGR